METLFIIVFNIFLVRAFSDDHPDTYLSITQLAEKYGYPMENHDVTTEDGYILRMFRIPHGKNGSEINSRPILLMHGLYGQAENFIVNGMHNGSLAYLMADNGYDVWLGNSRGTAHSRRHIKLDPNFPEFWNFSWDEIGTFDLPAKIDYILAKVDKENLYFVGHSQGATTFLVLSTEKPNYQKKIRAAALLAPAVYIEHITEPVFQFMAYKNRAEFLLKSAERNGFHEFPAHPNSIKNILNNMCINTDIFVDACQRIMELLTGGSPKNIDPRMLVLLFQSIPTVSIRQLVHYFQEIRSKRFCKWDYGKAKNMDVYGTPNPPDYPLKNISIPIEIYSGIGDTLVSHIDASKACEELANCRRNVIIKDVNWIHASFFCDVKLGKTVNEPVLRFMNEYQ